MRHTSSHTSGHTVLWYGNRSSTSPLYPAREKALSRTPLHTEVLTRLFDSFDTLTECQHVMSVAPSRSNTARRPTTGATRYDSVGHVITNMEGFESQSYCLRSF